MPAIVTVHTFFRQTVSTTLTCTGSWWVPPPGITEWTSTCANADRSSTRTGRVVGIEPYTIDGSSRPAIHVEWTDVLSRGSHGAVTTDVWIDRQTALMLNEHEVTDSHNDSPVGRVAFVETLDLRLRSLAPER